VSWYCYTAFRGVYRCDLVNWLGGKRALSGRENETLAEERWSSAFGSGEATFYEERRAGGGEFADQIGWTGAAWEVRSNAACEACQAKVVRLVGWLAGCMAGWLSSW